MLPPCPQLVDGGRVEAVHGEAAVVQVDGSAEPVSQFREAEIGGVAATEPLQITRGVSGGAGSAHVDEIAVGGPLVQGAHLETDRVVDGQDGADREHGRWADGFLEEVDLADLAVAANLKPGHAWCRLDEGGSASGVPV